MKASSRPHSDSAEASLAGGQLPNRLMGKATFSDSTCASIAWPICWLDLNAMARLGSRSSTPDMRERRPTKPAETGRLVNPASFRPSAAATTPGSLPVHWTAAFQIIRSARVLCRRFGCGVPGGHRRLMPSGSAAPTLCARATRDQLPPGGDEPARSLSYKSTCQVRTL